MKKCVVYAACICTVCSIISCNWQMQIPQSIRIKAKPSLRLPLGTINYDAGAAIQNHLETAFKHSQNAATDSSAIDDSIFSFKKINIYRYEPVAARNAIPTGALRYLLHYPVQNMSLENIFDVNMIKNQNAIDKDGIIRKTEKIDKQEFKIPKIAYAKKINIPIPDISSYILSAINAIFTGTGIPLPALPAVGTIDAPIRLPPQNISLPGFKTLTFGSGSALTIKTEPETGGGYSITAVSLTRKDTGKQISSWESSNGMPVTLSLANKEISNELSITFSVRITGSTTQQTITIQPVLSGTVEKATAINIPEIPLPVPPQSIPVPTNTSFKAAKIKKGQFLITAGIPKGWSGFTFTQHITAVQEAVDTYNGLQVNQSSLGNNFTIGVSLENQSINTNTITAAVTETVKLTDATYVRTESIPVDIAFSIEEFDSITLTAPDTSILQQPIKQDIPKEVKKWISKIHLKEVTLDITLNTNLSESNQIGFTLRTDMMDPKTQTKKFDKHNSTQTFTGGKKILDIQAIDSFAADFTVDLPRYNKENNTITLSNIKPGEILTFEAMAKFKIEWEKIIINGSGNSKAKTKQAFDISAISSILKKARINMVSTPVYLYIDSDLLKKDVNKLKPKVRGVVTCQYKDPSLNEEIPLIANKAGNATPATIELQPDRLQALKEFLGTAKTRNGTKILTGEIPDATIDKKSIERNGGTYTDINRVINKTPDSILFDFEASIDEIAITPEDYKKLTQKDKTCIVAIEMLVDMPLGFKIAKGSKAICLSDLQQLVSKDSTNSTLEIQGFGKHSRNTAIEKGLHSLKEASITVDVENGLGIEPTFSLKLQEKEGNTALINEKLLLGKKSTSKISITKDTLQKILNAETLLPDIEMELKEGDHYLTNGKMKASVTVDIAADVNESFRIRN